MKTKIKRHYRSVVSVLLSVCMLVSCMTVGLIATDAAKVTDSEAVGATVDGDSSVGDSLSSMGVGFYLNTNKTASGRSNVYYDSSLTSNQESQFTVAADGVYYLEFDIWGKDESSNWHNLSAYASLAQNGDYVADSSGYAQTWSEGGSKKFKAGTTYAVCVKSISDKTQDNNYKAEVEFYLRIVPDDQTVTITSVSGTTATVTGTNASGAVTISESDTNKTLTPSSTANVSVAVTDNTKKVDYVQILDSSDAELSKAYLTYSGSENTYSGSFSVPNQTCKVKAHLADKSSYKVLAVPSNVADGTAEVTTAGYSATTAYLENTPLTLHAAGLDGKSFTGWDKGTDKGNADATYYVNSADVDTSGGDTITLTATFKTNKYNASATINNGSTQSLYTGVNATFFDYYYDTEYNSETWLNIGSTDPTVQEPFTKLNTALKEYAQTNNVQIPLYFGTLYNFYDGYMGSNNSMDYNFYYAANDSNGINTIGGADNNDGLTGLSGTRLDNGTITHINYTDLNDASTAGNGVPMAMFDEAWLTSRTSAAGITKPLATIINSPFPVVEQTVTRHNKLYLNVDSWWKNDSATFRAVFYNEAEYEDGVVAAVTATGTDNLYEVIVPGDYKYVKFYRQNPNGGDWGDSGQQTVPLITDNKIQLNTGNTCSWNTSSMSTDVVSYKYYGFDSLNGKDNAYFTGISSTGPNSPVMNYYRNSNKINDRKGKPGFFPFDSNIAGTNSQAKDFGYGMKMNIEFQLGDDGTLDNGAQQEFTFSGDDDLWVFVDGQLILDLGGAHGRTWGAINFATGTVTANQSVAMHKDSATAADSTHHAVSAVKAVTRNSTFTLEQKQKHTMTIFYMERGKIESNLKFGFSMTPVKNAFIAEKALSTDTINSDSSFKTQVEKIAKANDKFSFTNTWAAAADSDEDSDYAAPAYGSKKFMFTHDGSDTTMQTDGTGNLPPNGQYLTFGDTADFIGQFTAGDYFKLTERSSPANKFVYNQSLKVTDMITQTDISADSAHANGYLFQTTKASPTEADPVKIRGLWTNAIATKDITITKTASETTTEDFEICVLVKLPTKSSFEAYPLAISGGNSNKLDAEGKTTINQNQTITISGIPVNAQVKVSETEAHGFTPSITAVALDENGDPVSGFSISDGEFTVPEYAEDSVAVTVSNTKPQLKNVKIYKTLTSGTSSKDYTMYIKTITALDDTSPADYTGTYTVKNVSDNTTVGTANQTYTSAGVSITTAQYILLENVSTSTKLEVTEKVLSSAYVRAFHYAYTKVGIGSAEQAQITATSGAGPIAVDNGVRFSVTDDTVVNVYNKPWAYYIRYNYPAYLARYYGTTPPQQFYDKSGTFTDADFDEGGLLTIGMETDSNSVEHPCPVFKDKANSYASINDGLSNFITQKAPYEDNFMSTIKWAPKFVTSGDDTENTDITYYPTGDNSNVYISTQAIEHPDKTVYAYFRLPYTHDSWNIGSGKRLDPIETDGKVLKKNWVNYKVATQYGTWITLNGATTKSEAQWVEAAPEIYDSTEGKYYVFDYWQMTSVGKNDSFIDVDGRTSPARLHELKLEIPYKRCYNTGFYMTMYQDSYVEAIYVEKGSPRANMTQQQKEAADTNQVDNGAVINFLENSRNQWNNNGGKLYGELYENIAKRVEKGDRIFSDFLLSFHMDNDITLAGDLSKTVQEQAKDELGSPVFDGEGNQVMVDVSYPILKGGSETVNYQIGVVIERVAELSKDGDNYVVETQETYKTQYDAAEPLETQKNNVRTYLTGGTNSGSKYLKDEFSARALDNKNEMEYSYSLPVNNSNNRQNYVYRAFAYLKDYTIDPDATYTYNGTNIAAATLGNHTGDILKVSDPVYFTIYDMASIQDGQTYTGGGQS